MPESEFIVSNQSPIVDHYNEALRGSPYLLPDDEWGARVAKELHTKGERIRKRQARVQREFSARSQSVREQILTIQRARSVYESNAIERAGLPLAETADVVRQFASDLKRLDQYLAELSLKSDRQVMEVLGLERATEFAKVIADEYLKEKRPLRETDIRSIHSYTMPGEHFAGGYRDHQVAISGAKHVPPEPHDVSHAMADLTRWLGSVDTDPLLVAAVAHSWLAAIHPFLDGNGRVSRLVANIALLRAGFPPLIVRNEDRAQYYDALAHSDEAGDLLPLYKLFVDAVDRELKALEDPDLAIDLFRRDTGQVATAGFEEWKDGLLAFLYDLRSQGAEYGLIFDLFGVPTQSTFHMVTRRESSANMWVGRLSASEFDDDWLLWLGFSTNAFNQGAAPRPALFVSERDSSEGATYPYRSPFNGTRLEIIEIVVMGNLGSSIGVRDGHGVRFLTSKLAAAELVADIVRLRS